MILDPRKTFSLSDKCHLKTIINRFSSQIIVVVTVCVTVALFALTAGSFLQNDFWQDEIYTLDHFIFSSWKTVVTDYHSTNNHIAFNIALKMFAQLFGIRSLREGLEDPYLIRLVPFLFSISTIVCFYLGSRKHYGKSFALTGVSILCTSIVFVDFSAQVRGYSFSIFLTVVLLFSLLKVISEGAKQFHFISFFLLNAINLLCLPTNIYLSCSIFLLCLILLAKPKLAAIIFQTMPVVRNLFVTAVAVLTSTIIVLLYYIWLLQQQPDNSLITSFRMLTLKNAVQVFAVFYHFTDYRIYIFFLLLAWLILRLKTAGKYSALWLYMFLFSVPFLFFFIHGAIIIQRTFLSLFPLFVLIVTAAIEETCLLDRNKHRLLFYLANILVLCSSFACLQVSSKQNNRMSIHRHDLRNHYYLVGFNAREVVMKASSITKEKHLPLFLWDDFGGTGVSYYLKVYHVPFEIYTSKVNLSKAALLLSNNKKEAEQELSERQIQFKKLLGDEKQYNLYLLSNMPDQ